MANSNNGGGAAPWLAFLVGALIVGIIGFFMFVQMNPQREQAELDINAPTIEAPSVPPIPTPDVSVPEPVSPPPAPRTAPTPAPANPGTPY